MTRNQSFRALASQGAGYKYKGTTLCRHMYGLGEDGLENHPEGTQTMGMSLRGCPSRKVERISSLLRLLHNLMRKQCKEKHGERS